MARQNRKQRAASTAAAGWAFSAFWHLLCLAVLILEVHPFKIPQETPTVTVELLPPIEPPLERIEPRPQPAAPAPVRLRPIQTEKPATVVAAKPVLTRPLTLQPPPILTPPTPAPPVPPSPSEAPRQNRAVQFKPVEVQRPPAPVTAVTTLNKPLEIQAPPTLAPPVQAPATPAPAPPRPVSVQAQPEVVPRQAAPLPVLTNDQTTIGPIEIKPPDHPQSAAQPAGAAPGGATASGAAGAAGAGGGGGGGGGLKAYDGPITGFDQHGLHTTLGCLNQDTYHLSAADRAACLQRVARETQGAADMGPNIPPNKQAEYDHKVACRDAYAKEPTPSLAADSTGSRLRGLGNVPALSDCSPADR